MLLQQTFQVAFFAKNEPADIPASFHCITEGYRLPEPKPSI